MKNNSFSKTIAVFLMAIMIFGLIPSVGFAQPNPAPSGEVKGFNKSVFDSHFSKADRELDPSRWLAEAQNGITQAIFAWEIIAFTLYENPSSFEEAKAQLEKWSSDEMEARFSDWLIKRFFGAVTENAISKLSAELGETQKNFTWHLDEEGNIIFDDKTGDPLIIRPDDEGHEFSQDLLKWQREADSKVKTNRENFENAILSLLPELLAYIPEEFRESLSEVINSTGINLSNSIKREFENIAAREERIFTSRRTRDIWSLRKQSDDEAAKYYTQKLISETEEACARGIEEINEKIEQASTGNGDLALLGEEWLRLYKEQFERGLKAWEEAEERFFVRRIEWEQETYSLFSEGEKMWLEAYNQLEEERNKWELNVKDLFQTGEQMFINISENFEKNIADAKKEFELNMQMRIGAGTTKVKALIDMYLVCASAAVSVSENTQFWANILGKNISPKNTVFENWFLNERNLFWSLAEINYKKSQEYTEQVKELECLQKIIEEEKNKPKADDDEKEKTGQNHQDEIALEESEQDYRNDAAIEEAEQNYQKYLDEFNKNHKLLFQIQEILDREMNLSEEINFISSNKISFREEINPLGDLLGNNNFIYIYESDNFLELAKSYKLYLSYMDKALEARDRIQADYAELIGTGALKDILADNASSEDFFLDEYQIALIRAKALVIYWERKTEITEAVVKYAGEIDAGRMTNTEGFKVWENAKEEYEKLLLAYENELNKLNSISEKIIEQQKELDKLSLELKAAEDKINKLNSEYSVLVSASIVNIKSDVEDEYNTKFMFLLEEYKLFNKQGTNAVYKTALEYGMKWGVMEQRETAQNILDLLINGDDENISLTELMEKVENGEESHASLRLRLAAIDLFANDYEGKLRSSDSIYSGADWYFKAKGIEPSEEMAASLYGTDLKAQLIEDYKNSYWTVIEKELEYLANKEKEETEELDDEMEMLLAEYYEDFYFCLGLLEMFSEYEAVSSFALRENWEKTRSLLKELFASYNITLNERFLPAVNTICTAIFNKTEGNFSQNTADFLLKFEECFFIIPSWLNEEIESWKNSFIEYIAATAYRRGLQPISQVDFAREKAELEEKYEAVYKMAASMNNEDLEEAERINNTFNDVRKEEIMIYYKYLITANYEVFKEKEKNAEKEKHWRQYLKQEGVKYDSTVTYANSWKNGILEDAKFGAIYYSNRLNDAFLLFSNNKKEYEDKSAEINFNLYDGENSRIERRFYTLSLHYNEMAQLGRNLEISNLSITEAKKQSDILYKDVLAQEEIFISIKNEFFLKADAFLVIGNNYDEQYKKLNEAHEYSEEKRFEYEKQDAIQRWASTAYMDSPGNELENCVGKLEKAQMVLAVLSDLYNGESSRPYESSEYDALYTEYKQSFSRRIDILEAMEKLNSTINQNKADSVDAFNEYQTYIHKLGNNFENFPKNTFYNAREDYTINDIITIKDERLAFSTDANNKIIRISSYAQNQLISFFNNKKTPEGELYEITAFEESLRGLSQRMATYLTDIEKMKQWAYARDYLLCMLRGQNIDLKFLANAFKGMGELGEGGSWHNVVVDPDEMKREIKLGDKYDSSYLSKFITGTMKSAWESLSAEEKADLEFYVILTLSDNESDYYYGFSQVTPMKFYSQAYSYVKGLYYYSLDKDREYWVKWAYDNEVETNRKALNGIDPFYRLIKEKQDKWFSELDSILRKTKNISDSYFKYCRDLAVMKGEKKNGQKIEWDDINQALLVIYNSSSGKFVSIKSSWDQMQAEKGSSYKSVSDALNDLYIWAKNNEIQNTKKLEEFWQTDLQKQKKAENDYKICEEAYIAGEVDIKTLKNAAEKAYGKNSAALKNHLNNMNSALFNELFAFMDKERNSFFEYSELGNELAYINGKTMESRYMAELAAREAEWNQARKDLSQKYFEWLDQAVIILENGRADWYEGSRKIEEAYRKWNDNFNNEYERVSEEWAEAYLAGLHDKEEWLEKANYAFNNASEESLKLLVGAEGERLSRFVDTREPFGIRDAIPETQTLMTELLQASGITSMNTTFSSLNNGFANITSALVKRGMGSIAIWDAAITKGAASDMARKTNEELAQREAKRIARSAASHIEEAKKQIVENIDSANDGFRESMDNYFILQGLWRKHGSNYVKDVIKGSTLFDNIIDERVTVQGYKNFFAEPIVITINVSENYMETLEPVVIKKLIEKVYEEIKTYVEGIFGSEKDKKTNNNTKKKVSEQTPEERGQSPGKFGAYIGYAPDIKPPEKMDKTKKSIFYDEGAGELGRLITEFVYWKVIDTIGNAELVQAPWDKRIWNDEDNVFKAPSIRSVTDVLGAAAAAVVATAGVVASPLTGGGSLGLTLAMGVLIAGINTTDDLVFNSLDAAFGYKTLGEAAFEYCKTFAINLASSMVSGLFSGVGAVGNGVANVAAGTAKTAFDTVASQVLVTGIQTVTSGLVTSAISGVTYNSKDGWGYSAEIFEAGVMGTLKGSVTSMASTLVTGTLNYSSNGYNNSLLKGLSNENKKNLSALNGLAGSLVGEGIDYAMGGDFTLNILNLGLFTKGNFQSGLLELHLGRGDPTMNIGTSGSNVSMDNLVAAFKGAQVWNVNSKIIKSVKNKENPYKAANILRTQYGYGDALQKEQLWDILKGRADINFIKDGDFNAKTTLVDGKRVITLTGFTSGMSDEEQLRLAIKLGHEAYRDGYATDDNYLETRSAVFAHTAMALRMIGDGQDLKFLDENLVKDFIALNMGNDFFNDYVDNTYDSSADYWRIIMNADGKVGKVLWDDDTANATIVNADGTTRTVSLQRGSVSEALAVAVGNGTTKKQMNDIMYNSGLDFEKGKGWYVADEKARYVPQVAAAAPVNAFSLLGIPQAITTAAQGVLNGIKDGTVTAQNIWNNIVNKGGEVINSVFSFLNVNKNQSNYVQFPDNDILAFCNTIIADEMLKNYLPKGKVDSEGNPVLDKEGNQIINTFCNQFVYDVILKYFGEEIYNNIFSSGPRTDANTIFKSFESNPYMERLDYDEWGAEEIKRLAETGTLVIATYFNKDGSGHIAILATRDLKTSSYPATPTLHGVSGYDLPDHHFVFLQAGAYNGVISIVYASSKWDDTWQSKVKDKQYFYRVKVNP